MKPMFEHFKKRIKTYGFVGLDFNMAVLCILAKRNPELKVEFQDKENYQEHINYWASKRHFGRRAYINEDDILDEAKLIMELEMI